MKKIIVAFMALLFLLNQSTWAVTLHYCSNQLTSIALTNGSKPAYCNFCKVSKPCCEDVIQVSEGDDFHPQGISLQYKVSPIIVQYTVELPTINQVKLTSVFSLNEKTLIDDGDIPIYLIHRQFRL